MTVDDNKFLIFWIDAGDSEFDGPVEVVGVTTFAFVVVDEAATLACYWIKFGLATGELIISLGPLTTT